MLSYLGYVYYRTRSPRYCTSVINSYVIVPVIYYHPHSPRYRTSVTYIIVHIRTLLYLGHIYYRPHSSRYRTSVTHIIVYVHKASVPFCILVYYCPRLPCYRSSVTYIIVLVRHATVPWLHILLSTFAKLPYFGYIYIYIYISPRFRASGKYRSHRQAYVARVNISFTLAKLPS